jgi:hypothetical protein
MFLNLKLYLSRSLNKISTLPKDTVIFKNACEKGKVFYEIAFIESRRFFCEGMRVHRRT